MEELPNEDNIDLETLQSQIDLSLAHTKNLVSSWLKPVHGMLPSSSKADQDREIEELLRRPQRLGVGAFIPTSAGALAVEGVKLGNKLAGKKRPKDADILMTGSHERNSDDDDEGRGRAIQKRARLDPFELGTHGKKKGKGIEDAIAISIVADPPRINADIINKDLSTPKSDSTFLGSPTPSLLQSALSERKKKKKKKKHKVQGLDILPSLPFPSPLERQDTLALPSYSSQRSQESPSPIPVASEPSLSPSKKSDHSPPKSSKPPLPTSFAPLLNLDGPPVDDERDLLSNKRKRKRRPKRKSGTDPNVVLP